MRLDSIRCWLCNVNASLLCHRSSTGPTTSDKSKRERGREKKREAKWTKTMRKFQYYHIANPTWIVTCLCIIRLAMIVQIAMQVAKWGVSFRFHSEPRREKKAAKQYANSKLNYHFFFIFALLLDFPALWWIVGVAIAAGESSMASMALQETRSVWCATCHQRQSVKFTRCSRHQMPQSRMAQTHSFFCNFPI